MDYKITSISKDMDEQIDKLAKRLREIFGMKVTRKDSSKVLAWKLRHYNINLTKSQLVDILGGKV